MTTEIAVLNRLGIALATDSAVTIGGGSNGKVFDTADKLFELSPIHPVALMINGNMDFLGVPWEIIVKDFREQCGMAHRSSIKEWIDDFIGYVGSYGEVSQNQADKILENKVNDVCSFIKEIIAEGFFENVRVHGPITKPEDFDRALSSSLLEFVAELQDTYDGIGAAESVKSLSQENVYGKYICLSMNYISQQFKPHPLTQEEFLALRRLFVTILFAAETTDYTTGIVVAGAFMYLANTANLG